MKNIFKDLNTVLGNENGGPNVEELIGVAVALGVGVGIFAFGRTVYGWFTGDANDTVDAISTPPNSVWTI